MSAQQTDNHKPDLEESINVSARHANIATNSAAASREQQVRENGMEPVSLWIFIACTIIAIIGGSVLFQSNNFLGYGDYVKADYMQKELDHKGEFIPQGSVENIYSQIGAEKYQTCAACHGPNGEGSNDVPPLASSEWVVNSPIIPALIVRNGLQGSIKVAGKTYNSTMAAMEGKNFSDLEMVALIYYIQNNFGNSDGKLYKPVQIEQIRKIESSLNLAGGMCTPSQLEQFKGKQLDGELFEAGTVINKKTGEVIEATE